MSPFFQQHDHILCDLSLCQKHLKHLVKNLSYFSGNDPMKLIGWPGLGQGWAKMAPFA
jgi:hypothetical protein